jgi:hypothetical protein
MGTGTDMGRGLRLGLGPARRPCCRPLLRAPLASKTVALDRQRLPKAVARWAFVALGPGLGPGLAVP